MYLLKFQGNGQVFEACDNRLTATQKQALSNVLSGAVAPVSNKAGWIKRNFFPSPRFIF